MTEKIKYKKGFKYQLCEMYIVKIGISVRSHIKTKYIELKPYNGFDEHLYSILIIKAGYAWDGCSGCTIDTKTNMRAGLVHDAICQLIRMGLLPKNCYEASNKIFRQICLADGMNHFRAWLYFNGVDNWLAKRIATGKPKKIYTAP